MRVHKSDRIRQRNPDRVLRRDRLRAEAKNFAEAFESWLAHREQPQPTGPARWRTWWTDGESIMRGEHCLLTRQIRPVEHPDRRPVLLNGRRYNKRQSRRYGIQSLEERLTVSGIVYVRAVPLGTAHSADDPASVRGGWTETIDMQHQIAAADRYDRIAEVLVPRWLNGESERIPQRGLRARTDGESIFVRAVCLVTWSADRKVVLVSEPISKPGTQRRLVNEAVVTKLAEMNVRFRFVRPAMTARHIDEWALRHAWESRRPGLTLVE